MLYRRRRRLLQPVTQIRVTRPTHNRHPNTNPHSILQPVTQIRVTRPTHNRQISVKDPSKIRQTFAYYPSVKPTITAKYPSNIHQISVKYCQISIKHPSNLPYIRPTRNMHPHTSCHPNPSPYPSPYPIPNSNLNHNHNRHITVK